LNCEHIEKGRGSASESPAAGLSPLGESGVNAPAQIPGLAAPTIGRLVRDSYVAETRVGGVCGSSLISAAKSALRGDARSADTSDMLGKYAGLTVAAAGFAAAFAAVFGRRPALLRRAR